MRKIFAANWKLHKNPKETRDFFSEMKKQYLTETSREVVFFPPATSLEATAQSLEGTALKWGSQNCHSEVKGAFTGEISAQVVKDLGGHYVLLGHSERRSLFSETDEGIAKKLALVQSLGLTPMLCIGESLSEREAGKTIEVLRQQLEKDLAQTQPHPKMTFAVAYEPVWAIGTGKVATTSQVQEAHGEIYQMLVKMGFGETIPLLYGGSVKPDNAKELLAVKHVDGFLVGGASLEVSSFLQICRA